MNRLTQLLIGGFSAGLTQLGVLYAAGITNLLPLAVGSLATMGTTMAGLAKQLPKRQWTLAERRRKLKLKRKPKEKR
jgi:L-lactate permease